MAIVQNNMPSFKSVLYTPFSVPIKFMTLANYRNISSDQLFFSFSRKITLNNMKI